MASDRGLPQIPRGLGRELTTYLQSLQGVVLRLSGLSRGSDRAVRVSDGSMSTGTTTASVAQSSIKTGHLADNAVTSAKITDGAVTESKLATSAVTTRSIMAGAVTGELIAARSVSKSKIADGVLPVLCTGSATDGEEVTLPVLYAETPFVMLTTVFIDLSSVVGVQGLRETKNDEGIGIGEWKFDAQGSFQWAAIGYEHE